MFAVIFFGVSLALYHHLGEPWTIYLMYICGAIAFQLIMVQIKSWPRYIGDAIQIVAKAINKHGDAVRTTSKLDVRHMGHIKNN